MNSHARQSAITALDDTIRQSRGTRRSLDKARGYLPAGPEDSLLVTIAQFEAQSEARLLELRQRLAGGGR